MQAALNKQSLRVGGLQAGSGDKSQKVTQDLFSSDSKSVESRQKLFLLQKNKNVLKKNVLQGFFFHCRSIVKQQNPPKNVRDGQRAFPALEFLFWCVLVCFGVCVCVGTGLFLAPSTQGALDETRAGEQTSQRVRERALFNGGVISPFLQSPGENIYLLQAPSDCRVKHASCCTETCSHVCVRELMIEVGSL